MKPVIEHQADEIDRILSREDEILPSSGFALSVMDAVRREASAPPPIPFPWKRALAGVCTLLLALGAVVAASARLATTSITPQFSPALTPGMPSLLHGGIQTAVIWTGLALLVAFVSVTASARVA